MSHDRRLRHVITLLVAVYATLWPFLFVRLHVNINDEFYQALGIRSFETSALSPLTSAFGAVWCNFFGETIISLRCFAISMLLLSIAVGVGYMYRRGYSAIQCMLAYTVLSMSLTLGQYYVYGHNIFGWDVVSYPFLAITTVGLLMWTESRSRVWLVISAVACGLLGASRLPSVVSLIVVVAAVIMKGSLRERCANLGLVLVLGIGALLAVVVCLYGSVSGWIAVMQSSIITGHSASSIIADSLHVLPTVMLYWLPGIVALDGLLFLHGRKGIAIAVMLMCLAYTLCYKLITLATGYMQMPCIVLLLGCLLISRKNRVSRGMFAIVGAMFFCMAFGSDVFPDRVYAPVLGAVVVGLYNPSAKHGLLGRYIVAVAVSTIILSSLNGVRRIHNLQKCVAYEQGRSGQMYMPRHEYDIITGITQKDTVGNVVRAGGLKFAGDFILTDEAGYDRSVFHYEEMTKAEVADETARLRLYDRIELLPGWGRFATYVKRSLSDEYSIERDDDISTVLVRHSD